MNLQDHIKNSDVMEKIFKGFSQKEAAVYTDFIEMYYPLLKKFAMQGGIGNGYTENE